jgi:hypothetical protein
MWTIPEFRYGLFFVSSGDDADSSAAKKVFNAFANAGLPLTTRVESKMEKGTFTIVVGRKIS